MMIEQLLGQKRTEPTCRPNGGPLSKTSTTGLNETSLEIASPRCQRRGLRWWRQPRESVANAHSRFSRCHHIQHLLTPLIDEIGARSRSNPFDDQFQMTLDSARSGPSPSEPDDPIQRGGLDSDEL
jgi:hypothetical protein